MINECKTYCDVLELVLASRGDTDFLPAHKNTADRQQRCGAESHAPASTLPSRNGMLDFYIVHANVAKYPYLSGSVLSN